MRKLTTHVTVHERDEQGNPTGGAETFAAGSREGDLPEWARKQITNPDVWDDNGQPDNEPDDTEPDNMPTDATIDQMTTWVSDDPARARRALNAELASPRPRQRLVATLESIVARNK